MSMEAPGIDPSNGTCLSDRHDAITCRSNDDLSTQFGEVSIRNVVLRRSTGANCRQRCTTLALMPRAIATLATDAPGTSHSATTSDFSSSLYRRRPTILSLPIGKFFRIRGVVPNLVHILSKEVGGADLEFHDDDGMGQQQHCVDALAQPGHHKFEVEASATGVRRQHGLQQSSFVLPCIPL